MHTTPDLELTDVTVTFGGRTAVDAVSLTAPAGRITGLIGPNGAGKTTTFNAATGVLKPAAGSVRLGEHTLDGRSVAARAKLGLGRTFQRMRLFESMTVRENVALGLEARHASRAPWSQVVSGRGERASVLAVADEALDRCGIADLRDDAAGALSTGQMRLVELARATAAGFSFLLLDEPSSGLDEDETEDFCEIVAGVVRDRGIGVLLVEHDMALVRSICSYLYVLEFGQLIHEGDTDDVLRSDVVRAAYLGQEAA